MKLSKTLMLAAIAASVSISSAYAGGDQRQRQIGEENARYFAEKGHTNDGMNAKNAAASQDNQNPQVSQYPCAGCTYDQKAGGYVQNPHLKR
jgi:hypothetical protein